MIEINKKNLLPSVSGVYAFGFLFMLPQLFVNYKVSSLVSPCLTLFKLDKKKKQQLQSEVNANTDWALTRQLKSVAHLPWKAFMYKVRQRG